MAVAANKKTRSLTDEADGDVDSITGFLAQVVGGWLESGADGTVKLVLDHFSLTAKYLENGSVVAVGPRVSNT